MTGTYMKEIDIDEEMEFNMQKHVLLSSRWLKFLKYSDVADLGNRNGFSD